MKQILLALILLPTLVAADPLRMLENGTLEQKIDAMRHLGYSGNKAGFWYFVRNLRYTQKDYDSTVLIECRAAAAEALGRIRDERAVKFLTEAYPAETNTHVRSRIVYALAFYPSDPSIVPAITDALGANTEELLFQGILASAMVRHESFASALSAIRQKHASPAFRATAAYALASAGNARTENIALLRDYLRSPDPEARFWAARHLGMLGDIASIKEVSRAIEIENRPWVSGELDSTLNILYRRRRSLIEQRNTEQFDFILKSEPATESVQQ